MINCAHCKEQLSAYLDGIMTVEEKKLLEEHLSSCGYCSLAFSELKKTEETLRSLEEVEPPPWFTQKIMNRVREEAEPRKRLLQRLFYPLHIKIPAEALATCLVVVLALFVYKNTEPEMKALHGPEKIATVSPQDQAQKQHDQALSVPASKEPRGKYDDVPKEDKEEQKNTIAPSVFDSTGAGSLKKDTPSPAGIPERQMAEKSPEGTGNRNEAKTSETASLKKQETMPTQKAAAPPLAKLKEDSFAPPVGSIAAKSTQEAMKAPASRELKSASVAESKQVLFTVLTNNIETTAKEAENLLNRFGAKNIGRSSRQTRLITFDADLPGQKVTEFFNALKTVGDVKGKEIPARSPEDYLAVRIEITGNP
jgi:hypothetical protein